MKLLKTTVFATAMLLCGSARAQDVSRVHVSGISLTKGDTCVGVSFTVHPCDWHLGIDRKTTVTPVFISADNKDTIAMRPFTVAGKNAWYQVVRDGVTDSAAMPLRAGKGDDLAYSASVPRRKWMDYSRLDFIETASCYCDGNVPETPVAIPVAKIDWRKKKFQPDYHYVTPPVDTIKMFHLAGRAYVNFRVNRTEIEPAYMDNQEELQKILRTLRDVQQELDSAVRSVTITGYASPEGSYANNERLAKGRAEIVRKHVLSLCRLNPALIHTSSVAEDWEGLRRWVENSDLAGRDSILAIIGSERKPDPKERALKSAFPKQYRYLLRNVYPSLRHTDYAISYNVRRYTDTAEIRRVMQERPRNLSLNELFTGATSYPEGSPEYTAAFELAASLYPDDETANLNAANAVMACGDFPKAKSYLDRAGTGAEAEYARGIFLALQGDYPGALQYLRRADAGGCSGADRAVARILDIENDPGTVTFLGDMPENETHIPRNSKNK